MLKGSWIFVAAVAFAFSFYDVGGQGRSLSAHEAAQLRGGAMAYHCCAVVTNCTQAQRTCQDRGESEQEGADPIPACGTRRDYSQAHASQNTKNCSVSFNPIHACDMATTNHLCFEKRYCYWYEEEEICAIGLSGAFEQTFAPDTCTHNCP